MIEAKKGLEISWGYGLKIEGRMGRTTERQLCNLVIAMVLAIEWRLQGR